MQPSPSAVSRALIAPARALLNVARYFLASVPIATSAMFVVLVMLARVELGHFPTPMRPDPGALRVAWLMWFIAAGFVLSLVAACLWPLIAERWKAETSAEGVSASNRLFAVGWTILIFIMTFDPGRFVEWVLD